MFSMSEGNAVQHPVKQILAMSVIVPCKNGNDQVEFGNHKQLLAAGHDSWQDLT